jgi:uncharacterized protein YukE
MSDIQLDLDQLQDGVIVLTGAKLKEIDQAMQSACNAVGTLTVIGWDGQARDEFIARFSELKREMRLLCDSLEALNECLKDAHQEGGSLYLKGDSLLGTL